MRSLIATLFILLPLSSWALDCGIEHKKFCSHAENGKPELITCLTKHDAKLGLRCRSSLAALKKKQKQNPCFDDIGKHCSDIPANGHALMICLLKHETKLSKSCASDVAKKKDSFTSKEPCAQDLMNKCYSELAQGEGYSLRCLFKNKGKLMARCETHIATTMQKMRSKNPCFDDTEKHCPSVIMAGKIDTCLIGKQSSLAPACKTKIQDEVKKRAADPCRVDVRTFCKRGNGREINACLTKNEALISTACKQHRDNRKAEIGKMQEACKEDRRKFCTRVSPTGTKILKCLKSNKALVSKACAAHL